METITDIPLYDISQEIESKYGENTHMVIEAFINDNNEHEDLEKEVPVDKLMWWCEFQDQISVFDNVAALKHWFLNEVTYDPNYVKVSEEEEEVIN